MEMGNYGLPFSGVKKYFLYEKGGPSKGRQRSLSIQLFLSFLSKGQFLVNPVRDVHEAVIVASRSR